MFAESLFIQFQQPVAMTGLFLGHFLEYLRRFRITLREIFSKAHVDAAVFLFR